MVIVSVTRRKTKITPFGGKGGILHLSYPLNKLDDPFFYYGYTYQTLNLEDSASFHF